MIKYEIQDVIRYISFDTMSNEKIFISAKENIVLERINYPGNCYTLDVTQMHDVVGKGIRRIEMMFKDTPRRSVEVYVLGKSLDTRRTIRSNAFYSKGVIIRPKTLTWGSYIVKTHEVNYVEEDQSKDCKNYPNQDFTSFSDCDDELSKDFLAKRFPNIIPVWLTDDIENVTTRTVIEQGNFVMFGEILLVFILSQFFILFYYKIKDVLGGGYASSYDVSCNDLLTTVNNNMLHLFDG